MTLQSSMIAKSPPPSTAHRALASGHVALLDVTKLKHCPSISTYGLGQEPIYNKNINAVKICLISIAPTERLSLFIASVRRDCGHYWVRLSHNYLLLHTCVITIYIYIYIPSLVLTYVYRSKDSAVYSTISSCIHNCIIIKCITFVKDYCITNFDIKADAWHGLPANYVSNKKDLSNRTLPNKYNTAKFLYMIFFF